MTHGIPHSMIKIVVVVVVIMIRIQHSTAAAAAAQQPGRHGARSQHVQTGTTCSTAHHSMIAVIMIMIVVE